MDQVRKRRLLAASVIVVVALIGVIALWAAGQSGPSQTAKRGDFSDYCQLADINIRGVFRDAYEGSRSGTTRNPEEWIISGLTSSKTVNEAPDSLTNETQTVTKALKDAVANKPVDLTAIGPAIDAVNNWGKTHCKIPGDTKTGS